MDIAALGGQVASSAHGHPAEALHYIALAVLVYCGFKALFHEDLKKVLLLSFVGLTVDIMTVLALESKLAVTAFSFHLFNFVVLVGLMFLAAVLLSRSVGSSKMADLKGVGRLLPATAIPLALGCFAMMGLPPFSAFSSKIFIVYALVDSNQVINAILLAMGELLYFLVFLRIVRTVFLEKAPQQKFEDAGKGKLIPLYILLAASFVGGLIPQISVQPFAKLASLIGAAPGQLPDLAIHWPLSVFVLALCSVAVYFLGKSSNTVAAFLSAGACAVAALLVPFANADFYGKAFAFLILGMGVGQFIYSAVYMDHSHKQYRFYTFFLLMITGLLGVALCRDLYSMFFFWEIMSGWCLWVALIHEEDEYSVQEASKYFAFNFAGAGVLVTGIAIMLKVTGSFYFADMLSSGFVYTPLASVGVGLLTLGFLMKAAQLPFRIDYQMHPKPAPTPISGYISSVMLKSGPFMMVKIFFIAAAAVAAGDMLLSLDNLQLVAGWVGALTIVIAASFAMLTNSMKRLLIFHTVSQLGYVVVGCAMMTSLGLAGGLLHFASHMFFKNLLFLCAGAVFFATGTDQMDKLGGLARKMPVTFTCFMIGVLAISGVPMFSGFVSKWMIYHAAMNAGLVAIAILSLFGSVLTLASFIKFMHSAYLGQLQETTKDAKEVSWLMLTPMVVLAGLSVLLGVFPGLALNVINQILADFNMQTLDVGLATVSYGVDGLNMWYLSFTLLASIALVGLIVMATRVKTRTTHVYACGVTTLTPEDSHVASQNFYEDTKKFIKGVVKVTKKIIGLKGDYVER